MLIVLVCASAFVGALVAVYILWFSASALNDRRRTKRWEASYQEELQRWRDDFAAEERWRKEQVADLRAQVERLMLDLGIPVAPHP
jgi:hypothetical protein